VEFCCTEEDVPQGEGCAEVAASPAGGTQGVMGSMEAWRDEDVVSEPAIADAGVRMRHAAEETEPEDEEWELERRRADGEGDSDEPDVGDGVFENVRSVVGPEGQLVFGVMQRVDAVPPAISVRKPVARVVGEIQDGEGSDKADSGYRTKKWEKSREREGRDAVGKQEPVESDVQPVVLKVSDEWEEDDAAEERVSNISRDGVAFWPTGKRPESLKLSADEEGDTKLGHSACGEECNRCWVRSMGWWTLSTSCRPPSCNCCHFFKLRGRVPEVCRERRVLCREQ